MARRNITVTFTTGDPICVATGLDSAAMIAAGYTKIPSLPLNEIICQMKTGGSNVGYVMGGINGVTSATQQWRVPNPTAVTDVTAELAPASATGPGGSFSDPQNNQTTIWGDQFWVAGTTGDKMIISFDTKG